MAYEKRLCILKQMKRGFTTDGAALSGVVYAEKMGTELTITPRVTDIAPVREGRYALVAGIGEKQFCFELKKGSVMRVNTEVSLHEGFSVLLCYVKSFSEPEAVAYGACGANPQSARTLMEFLSEGKKMPPMPVSPFEQPFPANPQSPRAPTVPLPGDEGTERRENDLKQKTGQEVLVKGEETATSCFREKYHDEAIAGSNYFERELSKGDGDGKITSQSEAAAGDEISVHEDALRADGAPALTYYRAVEEKLKKVMEEYPADDSLKAAFPYSKWANKNGALIGVIYREGFPRYLCVAVKAEGEPPKQMENHAIFVPKDAYSEDDGFYVVFQSAQTGEYIALSDE